MKGQIIKGAIKHAPKLKKAAKLTSFQKIIRGVKSSTRVIQQKLKTKQNLAKISEKIGDARNFITQNSAIRNMNSSITKTVNTNPTILKNIRSLKNTARNVKNSKELSGYLKTYFGGGTPKALPANAGRLAKLRAGLGPITSKVFWAMDAADALYDGLRTDAPKVRDTGNILTVVTNPLRGGQSDQSITNNIRNLATNLKHIGNQDKYKRTKLAGASMLKIDKTFWNPFDDNYKMVPNRAMAHNKRADSLAKLDAREARNKEKSDDK